MSDWMDKFFADKYEEGRDIEKKAIMKNMIFADKYSFEEIASLVNPNVEQVEAYAKEISLQR